MASDKYAIRELKNQIETRRNLAAEFAELAGEERPDRESLRERSEFHLGVAEGLEKQLQVLEEGKLIDQPPFSAAPQSEDL